MFLRVFTIVSILCKLDWSNVQKPIMTNYVLLIIQTFYVLVRKAYRRQTSLHFVRTRGSYVCAFCVIVAVSACIDRKR